MTVKRAGLGRNLSALLGTTASLPQQNEQKIHLLATTSLKPGRYQPRRNFDEAALQELAASIKQQGLLQPIVVRKVENSAYEILAGERRWRACQQAGLEDIPAIVKSVSDDDALVIALVENLQRENLSALEAARAIEQLMTDFELTHQQIANLLSKSRSHISNQLRLLALSPFVQSCLEEGKIEMGHARALLALDEEKQARAAQAIMDKKLSVRATEAWVASLKVGEEKAPAIQPAPPLPQMQKVAQGLTERLKTKVEIKPGKAGRGKLVIHYSDEANLNAIVSQFDER